MNKTRILLLSTLCLGLAALPPGLLAQRGPQDSWYLDKEVPLPVMPGLNAPHGFDIAPNGDAYVPSRDNDRVSVWGADGSFKTAWGSYGSADGQLDAPLALAIGPSEVYVTEMGNDRVQVFDLQGNFLRKWGSYGSADGQFNNPWSIALDVNGSSVSEVYVVEYYGHRVQVFDANGTFLRKIGVGQLNRPVDVKIGPDGLVYVSSSSHTRIKVFQKDGTYVREFNSIHRPHQIDFLGNRLVVANGENHRVRIFETNGTLVTTIGTGTASSGAGQFNDNYGVAVSPSGDLHVSCRDNHRIQVFDANGTYKRAYGFYGSAGRDLQDIVHTPENTFLIADVSGDRIFETDENGTLLGVVAISGEEAGFVKDPTQIALGPDNRIYVADNANHRIQVFERNGTLVRAFGSNGSSDGQFNKPWGIAVSQAGEVYVSDRQNHRIQVFDLNGSFRRKWGFQGSLEGQMNQPLGIDLNDEGNLMVVDSGNNKLVTFSHSGNYLESRQLQKGYSFRRGSVFVANLNNGLVLVGGGNTGGHGWRSMITLYDNGGERVKKWNLGGDNWHIGTSLSDGSLMILDRSKRKFLHYRQTYRTIRPNPSKEIPRPEIVSMSQRAGTNYLDLTYRINDADSPHVKAALLGFVDGGNDLSKVIVPKTFVGDVTGKLDDNVSTGQTHTVTWNAGADWNVGFGELEMAVLAQDDRNLLNLHFLTLPATDANSTQLKISRSPVTDDDLLKLWYWLLASGHSGIELTGGVVHPPETGTPAGFSPASVPGLKLWLDATDLDGDGQPNTETNGSKVAVWKDKSSNDLNASQADAAKQPTYLSNGGNGKPVLSFSNSALTAANVDFNAKQIFVVTRFRSSSGSWLALVSRGGDNGQIRRLSNGNSYEMNTRSFTGTNGIFRINGVTTTAIPVNEYHMVSSRLGTDANYGGHYQHFHIGNDVGHFAEHWPGEVCEILVYDGFLSQVNRTNVGKYLSEKWDVAYATPYALNSSTTDLGRAYLLDLMNLREATAEEVTRAKEGATPGITNQFSPTFKVGPGERPVKVNEYGFDTGATSGFWVVPK